MRTTFDATSAGTLAVRCELRLDGDVLVAEVDGGTFALTRGAARAPDAVIETSAAAFRALIFGGEPLAAAERAGLVTVRGDRELAGRPAGIVPAAAGSGAADQPVGPVQVHGPHRDEFAGGVEAALRLVRDAPTADDDHGQSVDGPGTPAGSRQAAERLRRTRRGVRGTSRVGDTGTAMTVCNRHIADREARGSWEKDRIGTAQRATRTPS